VYEPGWRLSLDNEDLVFGEEQSSIE